VLVWVLLGVLLGAAGIAVLGWFALRLWRQVRELGRDVAAAAERIESATAAIPELRPPAR
jgi:threonine/homoserine/homoserine lactone efflux protein